MHILSYMSRHMRHNQANSAPLSYFNNNYRPVQTVEQHVREDIVRVAERSLIGRIWTQEGKVVYERMN